LLFNTRLNAEVGVLDFSLDVADRGSSWANERAVLAAALGLAEELAATVRRQIDAAPRA